MDSAVHHALTICFQRETVRERGEYESPRPTLLLIGRYIKALSHRSSAKNLREMKDRQQTVGEMMKDRAVPSWHLQTAQNKTSFLCCVCEEKVGGSLRGCGARTCPQDKQGSDKTAACNIHRRENKQPGGQLTICLLTLHLFRKMHCKTIPVNPHSH